MLGSRIVACSLPEKDLDFTRFAAPILGLDWRDIPLLESSSVNAVFFCWAGWSRIEISSEKVLDLVFWHVRVRAWYLFHFEALLTRAGKCEASVGGG